MSIGYLLYKGTPYWKPINLPEYMQRFAVACIILNECLSLGKQMFIRNIASIFFLGFLFNLVNLIGVFVVLWACVGYKVIPEMNPSEYGTRSIMVVACLASLIDPFGFKMTFTRNRKFNDLIKGICLSSLFINCWIGYTMVCNEKISGDYDNITVYDLANLFIVLGLSLAVSQLLGALSSLIMAQLSVVRVTVVSEILFFFFGLYLVSFVGYVKFFHLISQETMLLLYCLFTSQFTRYNLSQAAGERLSFITLMQSELFNIGILATHGISIANTITGKSFSWKVVILFIAVPMVVRAVLLLIFWIPAKYCCHLNHIGY